MAIPFIAKTPSDNSDYKDNINLAIVEFERVKNELYAVCKQREKLDERLNNNKLIALNHVKKCGNLLDKINLEIAHPITVQTNEIQIVNSVKMTEYGDLNAKDYSVSYESLGLIENALSRPVVLTTVALGGVGTALAFGGILSMLTKRSGKAEMQVEKNLGEVKKSIIEVELAKYKENDIVECIERIDALLLGLLKIWIEKLELLDSLVDLVDVQKKYSNFSEKETYMIFYNHLFATKVYSIIVQAIIDENREIPKEILKLSKENCQHIEKNIMNSKF